MKSVQIPIAFFIFNRPALTERVFREIARVRPSKLLVVADGPRSQEEAEQCAAARAVIEQVSWRCNVLKNYSDQNLGCKRRVSSGLDWVFQQCEMAIILEDDCLPHPTFFRFCSELLERYYDNDAVMMITGTNITTTGRNIRTSYFFSQFCHAWGWASWRRAWQKNDPEMKLWPELKSSGWIESIVGHQGVQRLLTTALDRTHAGQVDTWDYQWSYSCWLGKGLCATPRINLITNIGFGEGATHTKNITSISANVPRKAMRFPLVHPCTIQRDESLDEKLFRELYGFAKTSNWLLLRKRFRQLSYALRKGLFVL